jgi:hypothetical protein
MGKVVPKPRRRPQGARKLEWEKIRINDLLGQLFACVQPDLGRCLEEFEYNGTVDAILEWAVKNIPRLLGYTDQRRREEVGLLYSILGGRLEAESQKAGFLPLIPAVLPSPQANRTFRHFFLDPLLAQAGFSHKRCSRIHGRAPQPVCSRRKRSCAGVATETIRRGNGPATRRGQVALRGNRFD